jgi:DNA mismatch repair protein MutL
MQDIIRLLPDSIANQIAAGEVVQRPASVVKELLENAIDAQARHIQLIVRDAGRTLIQVIDDGSGMSETDARLSFERHATSKIRTADDLFRIKTMGFRGEALASIAAVAQVEMRTRRAMDEMGTLIRVEGSDLKTQESVVCLPGTNFLVKNLFFNVPARRNFLKTNSIEMRHILDEFQRVALANSEIAFSLYHNDTEIYNLYGGKLIRRVVDMFGKTYREQLVPCQEETPYVNIQGYVGKPDFARKTRGEQFFFVNNRFVKHGYLHHALMTAFEGTVAQGSHPFYVVFIEIDPSHIDINIHPTKTEIKFDDERSVYGILLATIKKALGVNLSSAIDFEANINFISPVSNARAAAATEPREWNSKFDLPPVPTDELRQKSNLSNWDKLFENFQMPEQPTQSSLDLEVIKNQTFEANPTPEALEDPKVFQFQNRYIFSINASGVFVIDQRAANERIFYERYRRLLANTTNTSQQLLFPATVQLNPADLALLMEFREDIGPLGFDFDMLGKDTLVVRALPSEIPNANSQEIFEELAEQLKINAADLKINRTDTTARLLARRFAGRNLNRLNTDEINQLIVQLFASTNPNYTPIGEPIFLVLTIDKLADFFKP